MVFQITHKKRKKMFNRVSRERFFFNHSQISSLQLKLLQRSYEETREWSLQTFLLFYIYYYFSQCLIPQVWSTNSLKTLHFTNQSIFSFPCSRNSAKCHWRCSDEGKISVEICETHYNNRISRIQRRICSCSWIRKFWR